MKVKDMMTRKVVILSPGDTLKKALMLFAENRISGAPVVESGKIVGMVTEHDIIKILDIYTPKIHFSSTPQFLLVLAGLRATNGMDTLDREMKVAVKLKAKDFMNPKPITINHDADIAEAARLMSTRKINRLPVIKNNKLVGIVSRADIIRALSRISRIGQ